MTGETSPPGCPLNARKETRKHSIVNLGSLGRGIHDVPELDTGVARTFAGKLNKGDRMPPIDSRRTTLLLVVSGTLSISWNDQDRPTTVLGAGESEAVEPSEVKSLGAEQDETRFVAFVERER